MLLTVILCTHNPHEEVLQKTLEGLKQQSLDPALWELLLIDNASEIALDGTILPEGMPAARIVRESTLGLTSARLRGIREARGELLVFVDDDNVLRPDYLGNALEISGKNPEIGAFGGAIHPVFAEEPQAWTQPYWYLLAVRNAPEDCLSMNHGDSGAEPCGAGLCVRREVARQYARYLENDPVRLSLDRSGDSLASAGDMDLVYTAFDLNYGIGRFAALNLEHLIPSSRLRTDYFIRIFEAMNYSGTMLKKIRGYPISPLRFSTRQLLRRLKHFITRSSLDRRMMLAERRGKKRALTDWRSLQKK